MIIGPTENDKAVLVQRLLKRVVDDDRHPPSYENCIILKPWGFEFEMFDDKKHALWSLTIEPGLATSMHCHQHKTACLIPLTGPMTLLTLQDQRVFQPGQSVTLNPGTFHSLWNDSDQDVTLLEIESPSIKRDLIRLTDGFGRDDCGYEGERNIQRGNLEDFGYGRVREGQPLTYHGFEISVGDDGFHIRKPAKKGYWVARLDVHDVDTYKRYVEANAEAFAKYGAKFLTRGSKAWRLEGNIRSRNVILEFDSVEKALACYYSDEYQRALKIREPIAESDIYIQEGYDGPQPPEQPGEFASVRRAP